MRKIFNIETPSEVEWDAVFKIIKESFDDKYFMGFEISVPYKIYNSNAFHEWLEKLMCECRVNNSCSGYRFWRFDEHIMERDASYRKIIFRKEYTNLTTLKSEYENLSKHCENQKKEITLLLKQKAKLEKNLEACKNHQIDMLAYRDEVIGKISREKNELENANKSQTRYIEEFEENMKKGNEEYDKLNERYKRLKDAHDALKFSKYSSDEKYRKLKADYDILAAKYEIRRSQTIKYHSVHEFEQLKKANEFYRNKVHEMFDMLLTAEFLKKQEEKKEVEGND